MNIRPLTGKQQRFAEENHDLVHAFLKKRNLPESLFYDIVIFGYLRAVQEYCEVPSLRRFKFSTLAWKRMRSSVSNHCKYLSRPKRSAPTVSLDTLIGEADGLYWEDIISRADEMMLRFETELLLQAIAQKLPQREMRIIRMKAQGYPMHDIAKVEHITFRDINKALSNSYPTVIDVLLQ